MSRRVRILLWLGGGALALGILALLLIPMLVDVNRYRDFIEHQAEEALGREVELGPMKLSLLPALAIRIQDVRIGALPGEGRDDLLTLRALRVGARLMPLLAGKLEVTSLVVEGPTLSLERAADGTWNIQRLVAAPPGESSSGAGGGDPPPEFSVEEVHITGGTVVVRDAHSSPGETLELTLSNLDLRLEDVALDRQVGLQLAADLSLAPGSRVQLQGVAGPLARAPGEPLLLEGSLELQQLPPAALVPWIRALAGTTVPEGMLGERPLAATVAFRASFGSDAQGTYLESAALDALRLEGAEVTLRRSPQGGWNFGELAGDPAAAPSATGQGRSLEIEVSGVELENVRLRLVDAQAASPLDVILDPLSLSLDRLPGAYPARIRLSTPIQLTGGSGRISLEGSVGPLGGEGEPLPLDLSLELEDIPLAAAAPYLETGAGGGALQLSLQVSGVLPEAFDVVGKLEVEGAQVQVPGLDGTARSASLDATLDCDVGVSRGGDLLELRRVDITLAGNEVRLRGSIDRTGEQRHADLTLLPARLPLDDLNELLALAGVELPFAVSSSSPLEVEARVRGPLGGDELPQLEAKLEVKDVVLLHPGMKKPLEGISAAVSLAGETVQVDGFSARIGGSDLSGEFTLEGFEGTQVRFDLHSRQADFGELLSLVSGEDADAEAGVPDAVSDPAGEASMALAVQGTLRIDRGSFDALQFQGMEADLRLEGTELTLDPFRMELYQGRFEGTATVDLGAEPPAFRIHSDVADVDVDALLTENLDAGGLLDGKLTAVLDASGAGADYDAVVASLAGGGRVEVTQGTVGKLDMLSVLSKATGVFGEDTLHQLSRKLEQEGTEFDSLSATLTLRDGKMRSSDLSLRSADLNMDGEASVDLQQATLDGTFQLAFSDALSRSMRAEGSRAAQVFWDSRTELVSLPLGLSGPFDAPVPAIDWGTAVKRAATGRVQDELRSRLGGLLGGGDEKENDKGRASREGEAEAETAPQPQESATSANPSASVGVRIRSLSWSGSLLARDLEVEGKVRAENMDRGVLLVTDASGREVAREDLRHIGRYFRKSGADPSSRVTIEWNVTVDSDQLSDARFPLTVKVEVFDTAGGSAVATQQVTSF